MKDWHEDDLPFISKVADLLKHEKIVVCLVFLNKYEYSRQPYLWWYNRNDLDLVTQFSNASFIFSMGNPEFCFMKNEIPESEMYAYNYLTPLIVWKNMNKNNTLKSFIMSHSIKYFYFKKEVEIPDFIKDKADFFITSSITQSTFYKTKD